MNLYFYTRYFQPDYRQIRSEGTRKAIHGLASGLAACGATVTILCEGESDVLFEMPEGYQIRCFTNSENFSSFRISSGLKNFVAQHLDSHSLVILNGIFQPVIYTLSSFLRARNVPYIIAPHDAYHPAMFKKNPHLKWVYWYLIERHVLAKARAVQVLDLRQIQSLRDLNVQTPEILVPNGFLPAEAHFENTLDWNPENTAKLFFLGRLDAYHKGLDLLIDAVSAIKKNRIQLVLQGPDKGDKKTLIKQAKELKLDHEINFLEPNYVTPAPLLIGNYDIFCLPSRFEGFGLSALEAMLAGRVLLVSEVAGIAPHVQASGCGVIVAPTVAAIRQGLVELLERRSEWKEMGLKGREYALEHLRWDKISANALERYSQLVL